MGEHRKFSHNCPPLLALQHNSTFANLMDLEPRIRSLNVPFCEITNGLFGGLHAFFIRWLRRVILIAGSSGLAGRFAEKREPHLRQSTDN
jgi:hypothetical protein